MSEEKYVSGSDEDLAGPSSGPFELTGENQTGHGNKDRSARTRHSSPQSLSEEHYLSAALAEEGNRPSLAFVFPPLARAIEEAASVANSVEVRSTGSNSAGGRLKKQTGRAHLHVVENLDPRDRARRDPFEIEPPDRNYDCRNYDTCLGLAAALNWNSFACTGCPGTVNKHLLWRAHSEVRKNKALAALCGLPDIQSDPGQSDPGQSDSSPLDTLALEEPAFADPKE